MRILILAVALALLLPITTAENVTKLEIKPSFKSLNLNAGSSTSFNVKVRNPYDKEIAINARVVQMPFSYINESWIEINNKSFILKPKEERTIKIKVKVPDDVEGNYNCVIALTNDTLKLFPFPLYVNSISLFISISKPLTFRVYPKYIDDVVEPGKFYEYNITIENLSNESLKLNPTFYSRDNFKVGINATKVKPNSTKILKIKVFVPENAKGVLHGTISLGIESIEDWMQRVNLDLKVFVKPKKPFVKKIDVKNASKLKITVSGFCKRNAKFDVKIKSPEGYVNVKPKVKETTNVNVVNGNYEVNGIERVEEYTIENPKNGIWAVEILPSCNAFSVAFELE